MGVGFVFIIYLFFLAVLTVPAVFVCAGIGYFTARRAGNRVRRRFLIIGGLLPFAGTIYVTFCIVFMAIVGLVTGRDVGFGDGFDLPLHNHYHWSAIDTTDSAEVYDVQDKTATDGNGDTHIEPDDKNAFSNVRKFQEEGDWIAGAYMSQESFDSPGSQDVPDHWFLFNTRTHERIDARNEDELRNDASAKGIMLRLQASDAFYSSHRLSWIDLSAGLLLLIPPVAFACYLWKKGRAMLRS